MSASAMTEAVVVGTPIGVAVNVHVPVLTADSQAVGVAPPPSLSPSPAREPVPNPALQSKMDLVLTIDCTGSMGSYIKAARDALLDITNCFERQYPGEGRLHVAAVAYRDHPPQELSYITKVHPLSSDIAAVRAFIANLSADGGGDGPEAVGAALGKVVQCEWRPDATKVAVIVADAPPHGIGEDADGFPQGVPDSVDPFAAIDTLTALGVHLYPIGCLPALNQYNFAASFFVEAARKTGGKAVALTGARRLGDVILGASMVEMGLTDLKVDAQLRAAAVANANPAWTTHQVHVQVAADLAEAGVVYRSLDGVQDLKEHTRNVSLFEGVPDLVAARENVLSSIVEDDKSVYGIYRRVVDDPYDDAYDNDAYDNDYDEPVYRSLSVPNVRTNMGSAAPKSSVVTDSTVTPEILATLLDGTVHG